MKYIIFFNIGNRVYKFVQS